MLLNAETSPQLPHIFFHVNHDSHIHANHMFKAAGRGVSYTVEKAAQSKRTPKRRPEKEPDKASNWGVTLSAALSVSPLECQPNLRLGQQHNVLSEQVA